MIDLQYGDPLLVVVHAAVHRFVGSLHRLTQVMCCEQVTTAITSPAQPVCVLAPVTCSVQL